jgi:hypothetical protein
MIDHLYHPEAKELSLDEAVHRIVQGFRRVILDRLRGDTVVRSRYDEAVSHGESRHFSDGLLSLLGATIWVSVSDSDDAKEAIEFILMPNEEIWVKYSSDSERKRLQPTVEKVVRLLDYRMSRWMTWLDLMVEPRGCSGIADELNFKERLVRRLESGRIGDIQDVRSEHGFLVVTVAVDDEAVGRSRIASLMRREFTNASYSIKAPLSERPWFA